MISKSSFSICIFFIGHSLSLTLTGNRGDICQMCQCPIQERRVPVVFSVTIKGNDVITVFNSKIQFDHAFVNVGYGFDLKTGIFTCPKAGLYQFSWDLLKVKGSSGLDIYFMINGQRKLTSWVPGATDYESRTGIIVVKLDKNDKVWLQNRHPGIILRGSSYSSFNGMIL